MKTAVGIGISPLFSRSGGASPSSVLQPWYDSLSVKPSAGLWADLKTMAASLVTAGKWSEFDFFSLIAAMETDEQRLRPLKTTSGLDITAVNSPTLDVDGVIGDGTSSYLNLNWNPSTNGVKYTLNDCSFGFYNSTNGTANRANTGTTNNRVLRGAASVSMSINSTAFDSFTTGIGFKSIRRLDSGTIKINGNGVDSSSFARPSLSISNLNFFGCCFNSAGTPTSFSTDKNRLFFAGSLSLQSDNTLYTIINTFFAARGLTTF